MLVCVHYTYLCPHVHCMDTFVCMCVCKNACSILRGTQKCARTELPSHATKLCPTHGNVTENRRKTSFELISTMSPCETNVPERFLKEIPRDTFVHVSRVIKNRYISMCVLTTALTQPATCYVTLCVRACGYVHVHAPRVWSERERAVALLIYRKVSVPHYSSAHNSRCIVTRNHALT